MIGAVMYVSCVVFVDPRGDAENEHRCDRAGPAADAASALTFFVDIGGFVLQIVLVWIAMSLMSAALPKGGTQARRGQLVGRDITVQVRAACVGRGSRRRACGVATSEARRAVWVVEAVAFGLLSARLSGGANLARWGVGHACELAKDQRRSVVVGGAGEEDDGDGGEAAAAGGGGGVKLRKYRRGLVAAFDRISSTYRVQWADKGGVVEEARVDLESMTCERGRASRRVASRFFCRRRCCGQRVASRAVVVIVVGVVAGGARRRPPPL